MHIASAEECKDRVNEITSLIETELRSSVGQLTSIDEMRKRITEMLEQTVTKTDESHFITDVEVRYNTWEELYPNEDERTPKILRAWWYRLIRRNPPFEIPGRQVRVVVTVLPKAVIKGIVGGLTLTLGKAESKS
jgi:hypothetical protein